MTEPQHPPQNAQPVPPPDSPKTVPQADKNELPGGPGAAFTFVYYFSGAALITAFLAAKTLGIGMNTGLTGQLALTIGTISGLLGTFFNRTRTLELTFTNRKTFTRELKGVLAAAGYTLAETTGSLSLYQRSRLGRLFAGDVYVQLRDNSAALVSRATNIRTLKKALLQIPGTHLSTRK